MALENLIGGLPGWEFVMFIVILSLFIIVAGVVAFVLLNNYRWPFRYVVLEDVAGNGYSISRRGRARILNFGDGGEEVFLLKHLNKIRTGYGKRIGHKQIGWAIDKAGDWFNFSFGDLNKKLLELGVMPSSTDVKMATASLRKGMDRNYLQKGAWEKYGQAITFGVLIICLLIFAGMSWYSTNKTVELAQISSNAVESSTSVLEQVNSVQAKSNEILERMSVTAGVEGSGIIIDNG